MMLAYIQLIQLAIAVGLSLLAGYLLRQRNKSPVQDDKPTTLATRGSFVPYVKGIRRVGAVFLWAGDREMRKEKTQGGKGFGQTPKVEVWYESGWHGLGVGPFDFLHSILQNGEVIFEGPISRTSHPSGTTVDLGNDGQFVIYWGEERQPINTSLGDASRVAVTSRWPFLFYVHWIDKRLGPSPTWPLLDYVVERRSSSAVLSDTPGNIPATATLDGVTMNITAVDTGLKKFTVSGNHVSAVNPGGRLRLAGNALSDRDLTVAASSTPDFGATTVIIVEDVITGATAAGTLRVYTLAPDDGVNPAHAIAEMLFALWPEGLALDQSDWDMDSLEGFGVTASAEKLATSWFAQDGGTLESMLGAGLQDLGCLLCADPVTGLMRFMPVREPSGIIPSVGGNLQAELPQVQVRHDDRPVDRLVFAFQDREIQFRDMTIAIDDDGQAGFLEYQNARQVQIPSVVSFAVASKVAERRSQEELMVPAAIHLSSARASRLLIPGQPVVVDGLDDVMRVIGVERDPNTGRTELELLNDFYGVPASSFKNKGGNPAGDLLETVPDLQFQIVEVPEWLLEGDDQAVAVPRVRAHVQIVSAGLMISRDNVTYSYAGQDLGVQTGGTLVQAIAVDDDYEIEVGPQVTILGPDAATIKDFSADLVGWKLGKQVLAIGTELFFLREAVPLGGSSYRLEGLIRARYDTEREQHDIGKKFYVFAPDQVTPVQDALLAPAVTLFAKTQPRARGVVPLSSVAPDSLLLKGKGVVPVAPSAIWITNSESNSYVAGGSPAFKWTYAAPSAPQSGAGFFGAGNPVGDPEPEGPFELEFRTTSDVSKRIVSVAGNTYNYANADLVSDFGSEVTFKARVRQVRGGYTSIWREITVEKV